ncbi:cytochrome P450 714C2 [Gossypium australe]|uniref:Cytochrome P450 714C2 n=1 Tax=Gossypium australe TaxID=47621 RepID=A0A5B6X8Q3_9ROSI|nr:cytochrome P450 714C2 [Gossypium australe]
MTELLVLFAIIPSNFSPAIAPSYRHSPQYALLIQLEFGVNLLIQKIRDTGTLFFFFFFFIIKRFPLVAEEDAKNSPFAQKHKR